MILRVIFNKCKINIGGHNFKFKKVIRHNHKSIDREYTCSRCKMNIKICLDLKDKELCSIIVAFIDRKICNVVCSFTENTVQKRKNLKSCNQIIMERACE